MILVRILTIASILFCISIASSSERRENLLRINDQVISIVNQKNAYKVVFNKHTSAYFLIKKHENLKILLRYLTNYKKNKKKVDLLISPKKMTIEEIN